MTACLIGEQSPQKGHDNKHGTQNQPRFPLQHTPGQAGCLGELVLPRPAHCPEIQNEDKTGQDDTNREERITPENTAENESQTADNRGNDSPPLIAQHFRRQGCRQKDGTGANP